MTDGVGGVVGGVNSLLDGITTGLAGGELGTGTINDVQGTVGTLVVVRF